MYSILNVLFWFATLIIEMVSELYGLKMYVDIDLIVYSYFSVLMNCFSFITTTRTNFLKESDDEASVTLAYNLTALVRQMEKNEVGHFDLY